MTTRRSASTPSTAFPGGSVLRYHDLLGADLAPLRTAVAAWRAVPKALAGDGGVGEAWRRVAAGLDGPGWAGDAADAAHRVTDRVGGRLRDAADEAHDVAGLLDDALHAFDAARTRLRELDGQINAPGSSVRLTAEDRVRLRDPASVAGDEEAARYAYASLAETNRAIEHALHTATEADEALYWALGQAANTAPGGFDAHAAANLAAARSGREHALRDAAQAARLARGDGNLSDAQVTELDRLLAAHRDDPVFGAEFATRAGARGTLEFWAHVNDPRLRRIDDPAALRRVQGDLGRTLAAATRYPSAGMRHWEDRMIGLGGRAISDGRGSAPWGFQVMGGLLRAGRYGTGFLTRYGDALMAVDKAMSAQPGRSWRQVPADAGFNHLGGCSIDPVEGYLTALNHDPPAATRFFGSADHFAYCTRDRHWPDPSSGPAVLGHALVAGVTGRPYGVAPGVGFPSHDAAESRLMGRVVHAYAATTGDVPSALSGSLGRMAAEYLPAFHRSLSGLHHTAYRLFPPHDDDRAAFDRVDVARFLYNLGQEPQGYAAVSLAQTRYSADLASYHLRHPHAVALPMAHTLREVSAQGSTIQSIVASGRQHSAYQRAVDGDARFNAALGHGADWAKAGVGVAAGLAADAITGDPLVGPVVDKGVETAGGEAVDILVSGIDADSADRATYTAARHYDEACGRYGSAVARAVLASHPADRAGISGDEVDEALGEGVTQGAAAAAVMISHDVDRSDSAV